MIRLNKQEKKELFEKCWEEAKKTGKVGEELSDEAWSLINDQYERWDFLNGMDWNEQMGYEENWDKWIKEMSL